MKVGIITFHRAHNYGAVLQCYALSLYLMSLGHSVEVVDYYPKYFREEYSQFPQSTFRSASFLGKLHTLELFILNYPILKKRVKYFNDFIRRNIPLSKKQYNNEDDIVNSYDVLFFGSDQIWNPVLTEGFDNIYTGNFEKKNSLFVSYAASTTLPNTTNQELDEAYRNIISRFDAISVREKVFADYLNQFQIKHVEHVLDPVFLLSKEQWSNLAITPKEQNYLLVYAVPSNPQITTTARKIADMKGLKLIEIAAQGRLCFNRQTKQVLSLELFLGYFMCAKYIVTSSFHGTAFSIRFQKQFFTVLKGNSYDGRAYNLLKELNITSRAIEINADFSSADINYKDVDTLLLQQETNSKEFINKSFLLV